VADFLACGNCNGGGLVQARRFKRLLRVCPVCNGKGMPPLKGGQPHRVDCSACGKTIAYGFGSTAYTASCVSCDSAVVPDTMQGEGEASIGVSHGDSNPR